MDQLTYEILRRVILHFAPHEARHFEESGSPSDHIYRDLLHLAAFADLDLNENTIV